LCVSVVLGSAPLADAHDGRHGGRREPRPAEVLRRQQRCTRELTETRDRVVARLGERIADHPELTPEHLDALEALVADVGQAFTDQIAVVQAASTRDSLRAACDDRALRWLGKVVRVQIRTLAYIDRVDDRVAEQQATLDALAADLAAAEVVDADLAVAEVQMLIDNVDSGGLDELVLALDPTGDPDEFETAIAALRAELELLRAELDGIDEALDALTLLLPGDGGPGGDGGEVN
jgi:hypothetical protein